MATSASPEQAKARVLDEIRTLVALGHRFLITSHARPDGDSIGSQLALAFGLERLGKTTHVVNRDEPPPGYLALPGVDRIVVAEQVEGDFDACFVMECSDVTRPGLTGLEQYPLVNIDHHLGNTGYGAVNWFDESAAACGEMVSDIIDALGVPYDRDIGTHLYLAILTDTGSFRHSNMTARTFEICRRAAEAGVIPAAMARTVFDSSSIGRLKLIGRVLDGMQLEGGGTVAVLTMDEVLLQRLGCTPHDADGLINMPLSAREVRAVVFFKPQATGETRISLRSKDDVDVRQIALQYGGGGHRNASGFTLDTPLAASHDKIVGEVVAATLAHPR